MSGLKALEVDVDTRLSALWALAWERDGRLLEVLEHEGLVDVFASFIRAAYGRGYCDALSEERQGRRGELASANGYRAP